MLIQDKKYINNSTKCIRTVQINLLFKYHDVLYKCTDVTPNKTQNNPFKNKNKKKKNIAQWAFSYKPKVFF